MTGLCWAYASYSQGSTKRIPPPSPRAPQACFSFAVSSVSVGKTHPVAGGCLPGPELRTSEGGTDTRHPSSQASSVTWSPPLHPKQNLPMTLESRSVVSSEALEQQEKSHDGQGPEALEEVRLRAW